MLVVLTNVLDIFALIWSMDSRPCQSERSSKQLCRWAHRITNTKTDLCIRKVPTPTHLSESSHKRLIVPGYPQTTKFMVASTYIMDTASYAHGQIHQRKIFPYQEGNYAYHPFREVSNTCVEHTWMLAIASLTWFIWRNNAAAWELGFEGLHFSESALSLEASLCMISLRGM